MGLPLPAAGFALLWWAAPSAFAADPDARYMYDYALHESTVRGLESTLTNVWGMGVVAATAFRTSLIHNAEEEVVSVRELPGDSEEKLSLLMYALIQEEGESVFSHYCGFEDRTWVGVYNLGNGGGAGDENTLGIALNRTASPHWWNVTVEACEAPDDAVECPSCCRSKFPLNDYGETYGPSTQNKYYDTTMRPWYVEGFAATGKRWTSPYVYSDGVTIGTSAVTPLEDRAGNGGFNVTSTRVFWTHSFQRKD